MTGQSPKHCSGFAICKMTKPNFCKFDPTATCPKQSFTRGHISYVYVWKRK